VVVEDDSDEDYLRWWLEKTLPTEQWQRLSTAIIFHHTEGRPTGDVVNQRLDAIRGTHFDGAHLHPFAFVVADRDYRLEEEIQAEREKLKSKAFANQKWFVWQRVEIENYLICPEAIVRQILNFAKNTATNPRFPSPDDNAVRTMVEQTIESSREAARKQLIDAFERTNKRLTASRRVLKAEEFLNTVWQGDSRIIWCDAKEKPGCLTRHLVHLAQLRQVGAA
jgi:hypothetical protein